MDEYNETTMEQTMDINECEQSSRVTNMNDSSCAVHAHACTDAVNAWQTEVEKLLDEMDAKAATEKTSFSKIILMMVMGSYFVGLALGVFVVMRILLLSPEWSIQAFVALLTYIGAPVSVSIAFYSWKARAENLAKINKN
jgi:hypothetical protein